MVSLDAVLDVARLIGTCLVVAIALAFLINLLPRAEFHWSKPRLPEPWEIPDHADDAAFLSSLERQRRPVNLTLHRATQEHERKKLRAGYSSHWDGKGAA